MSTSKRQFTKTIKRAHQLIKLHKTLSKLKPEKKAQQLHPEELSDIVRAALVIAVSAFDAYFTDKFSEKIVPYIKKKELSDELVQFLTDAGFNILFSLDLLKKQKPFRLVRTLVQKKLERYVTQNTKAIDRLFFYLGIKDLCHNSQNKANRANLIRRVEIAIKRRHEIVHDGDLNSHGKLQGISASDVEKRIIEIELFVDNCEEIINSAVP
jgi:hypothetical protein